MSALERHGTQIPGRTHLPSDLGLGQEALIRGAIPPFIDPFVKQTPGLQHTPEVLHRYTVPSLRGADEVGGGDASLPEKLQELGRHSIAKLDRGQTRGGCRLLDLQAVLVRAGGKPRGRRAGNSETTVAAQGVRQQRGVQVPDVRRGVHVEDWCSEVGPRFPSVATSVR